MVMNKKELAPGIVVYSDIYPDHKIILDNIELATNFGLTKWEGTLSYYDDDEHTKVDREFRDTDFIGIKYYENNDNFKNEMRDLFNKIFDPIEKDYMAGYYAKMEEHEGYQILKYSKGGHIVNHIDDSQKTPRRISTLYYLNDDYKGGELNFPRFNVSYRPKADEMILFPSSYIYNHDVSEVTDGTRYCVVSWLN